MSSFGKDRIPFRKAIKKQPIVFDVKKRFEYLNGFSKRKAERKLRGNRSNMKKELQSKKKELDTYKRHVQKEFERAQEAVRHNYGIDQLDNAESAPKEGTNVIEQETHFYPGEHAADPFGEVSIQITSLESPEFMTVSPSTVEKATEEKGKKALDPPAFKKKLPTFAKFKHMTKSRKFVDKKKQRGSKAKSQGLKKVKSTVKKTKKSGSRFNR